MAEGERGGRAAAALDGLRVVELGEGKAVAYAGKLLRDLGAELIKVETPTGDLLRSEGPFPADEPQPERSGLFIYFNAGKRGARLDLARQADRASFERLLDGADVLLHSLRPAEAEALALNPGDLRAGRPSLIVAAVTTFGWSGPYAGWKGHPIHAYAGAGVAYRVGDPLREPLTAPLDGADVHHAAVHTAAAVLLAVLHRARTGEGQFVDISSLEVVHTTVWGHGSGGVVYAGYPMPRRNGPLLSGGAWGVYPTKDGHFAVMTQVPRHWEAFLQQIGNPEWARDERMQRLGTAGYRHTLSREDIDFIEAQLREGLIPLLRQHTNEELWALCREARTTFQPVLTVPQVCESDHLRERAFFVEAPGPHPKLRVPGAPYRLSETPWRPPGKPPRLDEPSATDWDGPRWPSLAEPRQSAARPLEGVRVLDLGQVWAGPFGPRCLADYGADVVAVQTARRPWSSGTPFSTDPDDPLAWEWILRNRRSIELDLATEEGRETFLRLAEVADVIVENFSATTLPRWGLTFEALSAHNRGLIMLSMPPMGSSGPWSGFVTYGPTLTGLNGMKSLHGYPEDGAVMEEAAEIDPIAGTYGVVAVLAALAYRDRSGRGQHIELAQGEAGLAGLAEAVIEHFWNGRDLGPLGNSHRTLAPHGMYRCRGDDQWIAIACGSDEEWRALCEVAAHEDWPGRAEFGTRDARRRARAALDAALNGWTANEDKWELTRRLQERGVPAFPVLDAIEVVSDPHLSERRAHFELGDRFPAAQLLYGNPWHLSAARPLLRRPGSEFGAHTEEVLSEWLAPRRSSRDAPARSR